MRPSLTTDPRSRALVLAAMLRSGRAAMLRRATLERAELWGQKGRRARVVARNGPEWVRKEARSGGRSSGRSARGKAHY